MSQTDLFSNRELPRHRVAWSDFQIETEGHQIEHENERAPYAIDPSDKNKQNCVFGGIKDMLTSDFSKIIILDV